MKYKSRQTSADERPMLVSSRVAFWALASCVVMFLMHFAIILHYSVNVPFWDEWGAFSDSALPSGLSLKWLFTQHNEHRIVLTKLLTWSLFKFDGWNIALNHAINFMIYGLILFGAITFGVKRRFGEEAYRVSLFTIPFLLSPINEENHLWAFQSQFHFF